MLKRIVIPAFAALAAGTVWAATSADASTTPTPRAAAVLRLEPIGDSITWGIGSSTGNAYRGPLWNALNATGYTLDFVGSVRNGTTSDPDNEGHSGWRIDQIAGIADNSLATYRPNVVTMMIGTNDLGQNYQVSTAPQRLSALVDQILREDPGVAVEVADLIVSTDALVVSARPAFNAAVAAMVQQKQAAGQHVGLADMSALTTADLSDSLHPNDNGYRKMADAFDAAIQQADAAGWITPSGGSPAAGLMHSGIAGKCLDATAGGTANGTKVELWTCNNSTAQQWTFTQGTVRAGGMCLDATALGTANGTPFELWDCNGGGNQQWQQTGTTLVNPISGRCLDDPGFSGTDGTQLDLWDCNGGANEVWTRG